MSGTGRSGGRGVVRRIWNWFWAPTAKWGFGAIVIGGFVAGVIFWGGYNWAMELSNTEEFCVSCHEMRDNVFQELKKTVHFNNSSGVRAICSDCHVPKEWHYKFVRKIEATFNELPKHVMGAVDTKEKFEAARLRLARNVWATMRATDSRECRNCHSVESMNIGRQKPAARKKHERMREEGQTCIDCHQGIAHELPEGWDEEPSAGNQ